MLSPWETSILDGALSVWLYGKLTINGELKINDDVEITGNVQINGSNHLILPFHNHALTPTLAFGDGDSGFYESLDDTIAIAIAGLLRYKISSTGIEAAVTNGPKIMRETASATNPTLIPGLNDQDTGIGNAGADQLSHITGGVEAHRMTEVAGAITHELTGDVNVNGDLTADSFPFESISNLDKQSFENLLDNGDFKAWSDGDSSAPDGWSKGSGGSVEKESTIVAFGSYSAKLISGAVEQAYIANTNNNEPLFYERYKGKTVTISSLVWSDTAEKAALRVYDGHKDVDSEFHSGGSGWELLTVKVDVDSAANRIRATCIVREGAITAYFNAVMLVEGSVCPAFSTKPLSFIGWKSFPPFLDENSANVANKPTLVNRGLFGGYSLPEYAAGEELLYRMRVPHSWDGSTNPWFVAITSISANEDVGDKYKFQLEWQSEDIGMVIPDTVAETLTDEITVSNGDAYYAEIVVFELDGSQLVAGQNLQARLRRIAASASSVSNEIIVWHWDTRWKMNKLGTESIQGY